MEAQQLSPRDWREFRRIRLAALADAPREFSSTLAEADRLSEEDWRERLAGRAQFLVRALQEFLQNSEFMHHLESGRVNGIAAKVAQKIRVLL